MNTLKKIVFFCCLMGSISAKAETPNETLTPLIQNMQTMQADFTQKIMGKKERSLQDTRGHMAIQRPGKFRWEVSTPIAQLIIANGTRLWVYEKDLEQVTIRRMKNVGQTPIALLSDKDLALEKDYVVKNPNNDAQNFLLIPKNKENMYESIRLSFKDKYVQQMELTDRLGHRTVIRFKNVTLNKPLSASLFNFHTPAHVDVIDETKSKSKSKR